MRRGSIVAVWIFASLISVASADVTVSTVPTGPKVITIVTELGDGRFRVELITTVVDQPTTFTIKGGTFDEVEDVRITANVPQIVFIEIEGLIPTNGLDSVEDINSFTSTATVILRKANVLNDVASIRLNTILGTDIQGDITGDINLIERNSGGQSTLISMDVGGDILGDVLVNFGEIDRLEVIGSIGTVANRSTISVGNSIKSIVADEIHADITTPANFSTKHIETTGASSNGDFTGSLDTNRLVSFSEPDAGISIAGHLKANLDFAGFVAVPIEVGGNLTGDIDITEDLRDEILI